MNTPSKKFLIGLLILCILCTIGWLYLIQPYNLRDLALVLLSGVAGISGTILLIGVVTRYSNKESKAI